MDRKMNNVLRQKSWSPYVAGSSAGILLCLSVLITGEYIGASTTFVRSAGLIEKIFVSERIAKMDYFVKTKVRIDWQWMFVVGIFFGSLLAANIMGGALFSAQVGVYWDTALARRSVPWAK
jgi:hypothetical protein